MTDSHPPILQSIFNLKQDLFLIQIICYKSVRYRIIWGLERVSLSAQITAPECKPTDSKVKNNIGALC